MLGNIRNYNGLPGRQFDEQVISHNAVTIDRVNMTPYLDSDTYGNGETIVISGEVAIKKPDPKIFQIALEGTGLQPEEVVYIGDTQEDVDGAIAAGIRPILIARPQEPNQSRILDYTRRDEQPSDRAVLNDSVTTINSLAEILKLLEHLHTTNVQ